MAHHPPGAKAVLFNVAMGTLLALLAALPLYPPLFWGIFLAPIPLWWAYARQGAYGALAAAAFGLGACAGALVPRVGWATALSMVVPFGIAPGLALGAATAAGGNAVMTVAAGTAAVAATGLVLLVGARVALGQPIKDVWLASVPSGLAERQLDLILDAAPALLVLAAGWTAGLAFLGGRTLLAALGFPVPAVAPFRVWRLPRWLLPVWLLALGLAMYGPGYWALVGSNLEILLRVAHGVQGLAVAQFFLARTWSAPVAGVLLGATLLWIPLTASAWLFGFAGMWDAALNFRRLGSS